MRHGPDSVGKDRMVTLGMGLSLHVLFKYGVWVERHSDTYRIILARKTRPGEAHQHQE